MGLLIGGRLDDDEETGDVGYVCRYLLTDWGRRERVARCCERCRRSEGSHRRSGWRGSGGGSATGLGGREIVGVRCRVRVRWRQARWCGVYNGLGRRRGVKSRRGGGWRRRAVWVRAVGWPPGFESLGGCRGSGRPVVGLGGAIGWSGGAAPIRGSRRVEVRWCGHAGMLAGPGHGRGRPRHPYPWSGSAGGGRGVRVRRVSATAFRVAGRRMW